MKYQSKGRRLKSATVSQINISHLQPKSKLAFWSPWKSKHGTTTFKNRGSQQLQFNSFLTHLPQLWGWDQAVLAVLLEIWALAVFLSSITPWHLGLMQTKT